MGLFLAIEAGGTKTKSLVADETKILARAVGGDVRLTHISEAEASTNLRTMLAELSRLANVSIGKVDQTCVGLAGLSIDAIREWAEREIGALIRGDLHLVGDQEIALDGAFHGGPGILIVADKGSNVVGRAADGSIYQAGGWGPALSDEGSGFWIGQEALRAGFWARIGASRQLCLPKSASSGDSNLLARSSRWPTPVPDQTFQRSFRSS
jgi:glucosamine kinase